MTVSRHRRSRRARVAIVAATAIAAVAATGALAAALGGTQDDPAPVARIANDAAPEPATRTDVASADAAEALQLPFEHFDGHTTTLRAHLDRPMVVNFFSSTCVPCIAEMPDLEAVHQHLGDRVAFVGLNVQDRPEDGRRIARRTGVTYELGFDHDGAVFQSFEAYALPTTVFVEADGAVAAVHTGALQQDQIRERIRTHLGVG